MISIRKKTKAFTLSELLVVLLITVIVAGLAFTTLNLVQKQMRDIRVGFESSSEKGRLKQVLWKDFNSYSRIYFRNDTKQLLCESPRERIVYKFQESWTTRELDSFKVDTKSITGYFMGKPITSGEVDALEIKLQDPGNKTLLIYKRNTAESFMDYGL